MTQSEIQKLYNSGFTSDYVDGALAGYARGKSAGFAGAVRMLREQGGPGPDIKSGPQWADWLEARAKEKE